MAEPVTFNFITDTEFRGALESDYDELRQCMKGKAWKAAHVIAGSIIEAVLIDYLDHHKPPGITRPDLLEMTLAKLIELAAKQKIISQQTADVSSAIRGYRNLIHPGRALRLQEKVDEDTAAIAKSLTDIIVREIAARKMAQYGPTAEQLLAKILSDSSIFPILPDLLKPAQQIEVSRLICELIPQNYQVLQDQYEFVAECRNLTRAFGVALQHASEDTKRAVAKQYVALLREAPEDWLLTYQRQFFTAHQLQYLDSADERRMVKVHLLEQLDRPTIETVRVSEGIGPFLDARDARQYAIDIFQFVTASRDDDEAREAAYILVDVFRAANPDAGEAMKTILARLVKERVDRESDHVYRLSIIRCDILEDEDAISGIPF